MVFGPYCSTDNNNMNDHDWLYSNFVKLKYIILCLISLFLLLARYVPNVVKRSI